MSDQTHSPEQADPIKNLKAEMDRKLGNADAKLAELQKTNEALLSKLSSISKPAPAAEPSLSDLLYSDPERYAQIIQERAEQRALEKMNRHNSQIQKVNSVIGQLASEYPELSDSNHALTKKAVEIYNALPEEERQTSLAYKMAVREAAEELSVKPKSKRPVEEPEFNSSYSGRRSGKSQKLDPVTEEFASLFGIDTNDAKIKQSLLEKQNRNWNRYEPVSKKK
jgi:hypothetical protein